MAVSYWLLLRNVLVKSDANGWSSQCNYPHCIQILHGTPKDQQQHQTTIDNDRSALITEQKKAQIVFARIEVKTNRASATLMKVRPQPQTTTASAFWISTRPSPSKPGV